MAGEDGGRSEMHVGQAAEPVEGKSRAGNFAGYLARNLTGAYRLAAMALGDPVTAQNVVHDAALSVWVAGPGWSAGALDAAFERRFSAECVKAMRLGARDALDSGHEPLAAAVLELPPRDRLLLARELGLASPPESAGHGLAGRWAVGRGAADKRVARILRSLPIEPADVGLPRVQRWRELSAARDPGAEVPLQLRLRLQRSLFEAEAASTEKEVSARAAGWGFVFNLFLAVVVLAMVVAVASVVDLRSSPAASADPMGDPSVPLTIAGVSVVQGGIDGSNVHVAATQTRFVAAFEASANWHVSPQECLADVIGALDPGGAPQWLGQRAGHIQAIAGDPSSASVYAAGPGQYCQLGRYSSADDGLSWSPGPLPTGAAESPSWLAFDPAHAGSILAFEGGALYVSSNSGATWASGRTAATPIGFDSTGRLVGWTPGTLLESLDDGSTWRRTGPGPADAPTAAAATSKGVLLGSKAGLWWYPLSAPPSSIRPGSVFSIAAVGDGAVVLGADAGGQAWLGTVSDTQPGMSLATLPPELASLKVTDGQVAANDSGAVIALSGPSSALAFATFAR
jgi:hypothetical protein